MEQYGDILVFSRDEQAESSLPETIPLEDAGRIRAKLEAQLEAVLAHGVELSTDTRYDARVQAHDLGAKALFIGDIMQQLDGVISSLPLVGVDNSPTP